MQEAAIMDEANRELLLLSELGLTEYVRLTLKLPVDVNYKDSEGISALMRASYFGHPDIVKLLLEHKFDVNSVDNEGWSPLIAAVNSRNPETVKVLLKYNANIESKDNQGRNALMHAATRGNYEIFKMLIEHGANFVKEDHEEHNALMHAILNGHVEIIKLLLRKGAYVRSNDELWHRNMLLLIRQTYTNEQEEEDQYWTQMVDNACTVHFQEDYVSADISASTTSTIMSCKTTIRNFPKTEIFLPNYSQTICEFLKQERRGDNSNAYSTNSQCSGASDVEFDRDTPRTFDHQSQSKDSWVFELEDDILNRKLSEMEAGSFVSVIGDNWEAFVSVLEFKEAERVKYYIANGKNVAKTLRHFLIRWRNEKSRSPTYKTLFFLMKYAEHYNFVHIDWQKARRLTYDNVMIKTI